MVSLNENSSQVYVEIKRSLGSDAKGGNLTRFVVALS